MVSIRKFLGQEDRFFDLLEASAEEACACVRTLLTHLQKPGQLKTLDEFVAYRRKDKAISAQISEALCTTFVTALEREDIESLSVALYRIPKTVEKIAERMLLAPEHLSGVDLTRQGALLGQAVDIVLAMIRELRKGVHLDRIKRHNDQLQMVESEADDVLLDLLRGLYSGPPDTIRAVFLKDLFELLEKVADRCRDAGNVITHIVLKNS